MKAATINDKEQVISIIMESFHNNPSVNRVIKNDHKREYRLYALAEYAFNKAFRRKGVWLSDDGQGLAIFYRYNERKEDLIDYWNQVKLAFKAIGLFRSLGILKRENYMAQQRPKDGNFFYFWFFGVSNKARGSRAAYELRDEIFKLSSQLKLPLYMETSVPQNQKVYERFGFETYHTWNQPGNGEPLWFMRKTNFS